MEEMTKETAFQNVIVIVNNAMTNAQDRNTLNKSIEILAELVKNRETQGNE